MIKKILKFIVLSVLLYSCNEEKTLDVKEDYNSLFPWKGIDKAESAYEDMDIKPCNPGQALENYVYPGKNIANKRTYNVVLECSYKESPSSSGSRYEFRFIDENKNIVSLGTKSTQSDISYILQSNEVYSKTFKVQSGYPMYLFVNGGGKRFSSVKAKITAVSEDGLIVVPILSTEYYQNNMGFDIVKKPYCEYIILP